ncbi:MAG: tRNA (adenosine(37)-N6)-threonylcarbamoyltransferase complex dimerization subunit type 1 TsaB [Saprospiraceae bacterium]|nr:tRNA (adenosine(37)-N6)-threonylcarbamoyltransferase complex dimerization subunit type 1 TsaB [Saprospiraceae bacterium]
MTNPLILNIEAATGVCSVCLSRGREVLSLHESVEQNEHSRVITLLIQRCMEDAQLELSALDAVAVSEGPGSYTSLRVGYSTAKGLCYSLGVPLIAVNTLAALAQAAYQAAKEADALYCAMIDARRMEVYAGLYEVDGTQLLPPTPMVVDGESFQSFFAKGRKIIFCGNGAEKCKTVLANPLADFSEVKNCSSLYLIEASINSFMNKNFLDAAYSIPLYLKPPNITISKQKSS